MGAEYKTLCEIKIVTDHDTEMYHMGEVDGMFQDEELVNYVRKYGASELFEHLAYLQKQVFDAKNKIMEEAYSNTAKVSNP